MVQATKVTVVSTTPMTNSKKPYRKNKRKHRKGPKRALSGYMFFVKLRRESVKIANPTLDNKTLVSKLGEMWRSMTALDKAEFTTLSLKDKERYEDEKKNWVPSEHEPKRKVKKPRKPGPKRALSAYMFFVKLQRDNVKKANVNAENRQIISKLGTLWRQMSDKDKMQYEVMAEKDKVRFTNEKIKWDANNAHLVNNMNNSHMNPIKGEVMRVMEVTHIPHQLQAHAHIL